MPGLQQGYSQTSMSTRRESNVRHLRERMHAAGLQPVQFWVPDTRSPEFMEQVREQCQSLKGVPAEADVLRFTEEAASQVDGWE
jgi:hypothetical protein